MRRKREPSSELIRLDEDGVQLEKLPLQTGFKLLANEEFENEKGGYESESEEDEGKKVLEYTSDVKKVSKKRKALKKLQGSKYVWNFLFTE